MTEYSKQILSDPKLLREKLSIYLNGSDSVENYARACEKFFEAGKGEELKFKATWSWWGFLLTLIVGNFWIPWLLLYRGAVSRAFWIIMYAILVIIVLVLGEQRGVIVGLFLTISMISIPFYVGFISKYAVCEIFVKKLDRQDDTELKANQGWFSFFLFLSIFVGIALLILR